METYMIILAMVGMTIGALGFLASVGGIFYVVFFRGKGNRTPAARSGTATVAHSQSEAGPA